MKAILETVFPPKCFGCDLAGFDPVCPACLENISYIKDPLCLKCGKPCFEETKVCRACRKSRFSFEKARSLGVYEGSLRELVHALKYHNGKRLAGLLAELMLQVYPELVREHELLTYVPLTRRKEAVRGFNQSKLLARSLSRLADRPVKNLLIRNCEHAEQHKLPLEERRQNVRGAFRAFGVPPSRLLLVDDVFTSGSTAAECSKALLKEGAESVSVLTVARTV